MAKEDLKKNYQTHSSISRKKKCHTKKLVANGYNEYESLKCQKKF